MRSETVRRVAPLAAALAVLAVVAGSAHLLGRSGPADTAQPPPLRLAGIQVAAGAQAADGRFVLDGVLPDGPDHARVQRFAAPNRDGAVRLQDALGLAGSFRDEPGARVLRDGSRVLRVQDLPGSPWQFSRGDAGWCSLPPPTPADAAVDEAFGCQVEPDRTVTTADSPPAAHEADRLAHPVLEAAGVDPADARVSPGGPPVTVTVDPTVAGLPTAGAATSVTVGSDSILGAQGWLGRTRPGDRYPVIGARAAFERLAAAPTPMPLMACPMQEAEARPLECGGPVTITGAVFGLSLQWEGSRPLLVPSWLFHVEGSQEPLAQVAVDPAYLAEPTSPPSQTEVPPSAPGGGGAPGSSGTAAPVDPAEPTQPSAPPPSRFESVRRGSDPATLAVTFYGGVEDCFEYDVAAKESADRVALTLTESRRPSADVCVEMAQQYRLAIRLDRPLGDREVIDAATGATLLPGAPRS